MSIGFILVSLLMIALCGMAFWQPEILNLGKPTILRSPRWYVRGLCLTIIGLLIFTDLHGPWH